MSGTVICLFALISSVSASILKKTSQCKSMDIDLCRNMPYNRTISPNPFFYGDEITLQNQAKHYQMFFSTHCNPHVQFFVCSTFAPMCPEQIPQAVASCRSVCEEVKRDCEHILMKIGLDWPETFNCSRFREDSTKMCMTPPKHPFIPMEEKEIRNFFPRCPYDLVDLDTLDVRSKCAFRCDKPTMYSSDAKEHVKQHLLILSLVNTIVNFVTALTFLINGKRFRLPERSILYMAVCNLLYSLPNLLRANNVLSFEEAACSRLHADKPPFLIQSAAGHDNIVCIANFFFVFFFGTASNLWWLMLAFTWYLSAARKWVEEELRKRSVYFHLSVWGPTLLLTTIVLILNKVDASELTGICSVGNMEPRALLIFMFLTQSIPLIAGSGFIMAGFSSLCYERKSFKRKGTDTSKLNNFMIKMGAFTLVYVSATTVSSLCDIKHFLIISEWTAVTIDCKLNGGLLYDGMCARPEKSTANYRILQMYTKTIMCVSTIIWILSVKTWTAWCYFFCCCLLNKSPAKQSKIQHMEMLSFTQQYSISAYQSNNQQQQLQQPLIESNNTSSPAIIIHPPITNNNDGMNSTVALKNFSAQAAPLTSIANYYNQQQQHNTQYKANMMEANVPLEEHIHYITLGRQNLQS